VKSMNNKERLDLKNKNEEWLKCEWIKHRLICSQNNSSHSCHNNVLGHNGWVCP
jgi:hypothetical protein